MKNRYITPVTEMLDYVTEEELLTVSANGIGYGGVDNEGGKDPASRLFDDFDDWEE